MIDKSAIFSPDRKYRYTLNRIWNRKKGHVLFVCLNPSTADENVDDPTIRRCIRFAESWGYGGMVMCNLFALRSTDPKILYVHEAPNGMLNNFHIEHEDNLADITVAAWGMHGALMNRGPNVARLYLARPMCLSLTKNGHPRHPLYLKKNLKPVPFWPA